MIKRLLKSLVLALPRPYKERILLLLHADLNQLDFNNRFMLKNIHVKNCKVLVDRKQMIGKMREGGIIAEIGVEKGDFSEEILKITNPKKFHLIDQWKGKTKLKNKEKVEKRFKQEILDTKIVINHGDSLDVLQSFPNNYLDWVYLDTSHTFEHTYKELELSAQKVKESGIICGHDFAIGNWKHLLRYGVIEAVFKFCTFHKWEIIYITMESDLYWSFAIKKIS